MHTIELLEEATGLAKRLGYAIRQDWFDGNGGGACRVKGKKLLFLDLGSTPSEQLEIVLDLLRQDPELSTFPMSPELCKLLQPRAA